MPLINKPVDINKIWSAGGDVVKPSDTKISTGWEVEVPPRQWFNWLDNRQDTAIAHINQHGIPVWDTLTEYQGNLSVALGSDGNIYKCKVTNAGNNPVLDTNRVYWKLAFTANPQETQVLQGDAGVTDLGNGLLLQWGVGLAGADNVAGPLVTFARPFTTGVFSLVAMHAPSSTGAVPISSTEVTLTSFKLRTDNLTQVGVMWMAIGV